MELHKQQPRLLPDIEIGVSMFKPKTLSDACCLAKLQEFKYDVVYEEIKVRVSEMEDNNKCVSVLDDLCEEDIEKSSEIEINSISIMVLDNPCKECDQCRERKSTSFSSFHLIGSHKFVNHVGESGDSVIEIVSKVTQEDKEDDVVTEDEKVMCLGILDYDVDGMKNNATTIGFSKIRVVDVYGCMFNFSKRYRNTNFNKLVEMYKGKYDDNKEEDDDFVVCDSVQPKGVYFLKKDSTEPTKLEGSKLYNRLSEPGISITVSRPSQSTVPKQSPSSVNKKSVSFKELLADKNKNEADKDKNEPETITSGQDSIVEKTLYVNTVHVVKSPKEASVLSITKPESYVNESFESDTCAKKLKHDIKTKGWEDFEFDEDKFKYKILKIAAYALDVHSSSGKTFTCND
ncbi:hypothetical protein Tco_0911190 [Tanacetum coccineum]|uniref:Uncharacterized protein n=1 Tax=Tanacetum coccineum TaxID=301880 RepID=A0ABQ5CV36_9ASTR